MRVPKYYRIKGEILALTADLAPGSAVPADASPAEPPRLGLAGTIPR